MIAAAAGADVLALGFRHAGWLWLLVLVAALAALYVALQARRGQYAVRFTNLELLDKVAPNQPRWRRHVPAACFVVALVPLVMAVAGPWHYKRVPRNRASIMLAIDTSLSMKADDVSPNRIRAAKKAAEKFLGVVPKDINVGLVGFHGNAELRVEPTTNRSRVRRSIAALKLGEATAIGSAIEASLDGLQSVPKPKAGQRPPAYIVLLSDGTTTTGTANSVAARDARRRRVPVETIAFGTQGATIEIQGQVADVSVNRAALERIAQQTGGKAFTAESASEIRSVYQQIGTSLGYNKRPKDLTPWFIAAGLVLLMAAAGLSLVWFSRLP